LREFKEPLFLCGESLDSGVVAGIVASHEVQTPRPLGF
jgi:hypothetical protein